MFARSDAALAAFPATAPRDCGGAWRFVGATLNQTRFVSASDLPRSDPLWRVIAQGGLPPDDDDELWTAADVEGFLAASDAARAVAGLAAFMLDVSLNQSGMVRGRRVTMIARVVEV